MRSLSDLKSLAGHHVLQCQQANFDEATNGIDLHQDLVNKQSLLVAQQPGAQGDRTRFVDQ